MPSNGGPLRGVRIVELAGLGPAPFAGMMLADHGADVIRVGRLTPGVLDGADPAHRVLNRSRRSIAVDLKQPDGQAIVRALCATADGLIEGFRPDVMERLGLGPAELLGDNPRLVYGRMTGWGQTGPLAATAGHDINYIALSGALHAIGEPGGDPVPPLNLVGDFGGGGAMLAFGMLAAILHARATGRGQVVDCAMTEGSAALMAMPYSLYAAGMWRDERGANMLDGGAHFYGTYRTADDRHVAVGPVEPQFYRQLLDILGLADDPAFARQNDPAHWPALRARVAERFQERTRDEWESAFAGGDACVTPVLSMAEAPAHPHNAVRASFVEVDGVVQPAPAPRYSDTPCATPRSASRDCTALLAEVGFGAADIERLRTARAFA